MVGERRFGFDKSKGDSGQKHELGDSSGAGGRSSVNGGGAAGAATYASATAVSPLLPGRHFGRPHVLGLVPGRGCLERRRLDGDRAANSLGPILQI